ncbi:hypothetical protein C8R43DRAFT_942797 [Mycena crocata]|nr:hypothetical protein C8R43DRAFT_942797 [Mycena crocata]
MAQRVGYKTYQGVSANLLGKTLSGKKQSFMRRRSRAGVGPTSSTEGALGTSAALSTMLSGHDEIRWKRFHNHIPSTIMKYVFYGVWLRETRKRYKRTRQNALGKLLFGGEKIELSPELESNQASPTKATLRQSQRAVGALATMLSGRSKTEVKQGLRHGLKEAALGELGGGRRVPGDQGTQELTVGGPWRRRKRDVGKEDIHPTDGTNTLGGFWMRFELNRRNHHPPQYKHFPLEDEHSELARNPTILTTTEPHHRPEANSKWNPH